jgi:hypothetical protein
MDRFIITFTLAATMTLLCGRAQATTLGPELKAYDFAQAYYIEDGGIVIAPQDGFFCPNGVTTPEGIRVMPGDSFVQFDPNRMVMESYQFTRLAPAEKRAFFHERRYHYKVVGTKKEKFRIVPLEYIDSDDFYLTQNRLLEWFDFAFPYTELHPGEQLWRTRP